MTPVNLFLDKLAYLSYVFADYCCTDKHTTNDRNTIRQNTYVIVECIELMSECQVVVVGSQVCHHQSASVSCAGGCCVAGVVGVTCRNVWMLYTQVIYAVWNGNAVPFRSMA